LKDIFYKIAFLFALLFCFLNISVFGQYSNDSIKAGSYIINMGVVPQTRSNALRPYGIVFELIKNRIVPVKWVINPSKAKDGNDFHHNGTFYKGSAFIIPKEFITPVIQTLITTWNGLGVVGAYSAYDTILPVYATLTSWPRAVLDEDKGDIVEGYFDDALIPASAYSFGLPSSLNICNDFFALPHADPTWATHSNFYNFVTTNKGYIWGACHAVSMLEAITNPGNTIQLNFLSNSGLQCYSGGKCNTISEVHGNASTPINFNSLYSTDPVTQYIGDLVPATNNGSEEWFIPLTLSTGWHSGVKRIITTNDGTPGKEGIKLAYGHAYNNIANGKVMYMGGHDHGGTGASEVAAQRAFFNFVLLTGEEKKPSVSLIGVTDSMGGGNTRTLSVNVSGGTPAYTYLWSASAGTLSNPTSASTQYTAPNVALGQTLNVVIRCQVTDGCSRWNFSYDFSKIVHPIILDNLIKEFNAEKLNESSTKLNSKISNLQNVKEVFIERSTDGINFQTINHFLPLQENNIYYDRNVPPGDDLYYRIKVIFEQKTEYSQIVKIQKRRVHIIGIFPNPAKTGITITGINTVNKAEISIFDFKGSLLLKRHFSGNSNRVSINGLELLKPGIYLIEILSNGMFLRDKLIIEN
jgi:hypothetical protein